MVADATQNRDDSTLHHIKNTVKKMKRLVDELPLEDPKVILDIGANCGWFSFFAKRRFPQARIFAFEPSPTLQDVLQHNLGQFSDVEINNLAVSDKDEEKVIFYINEKIQQTNSLNISAVEPFASADEVLKIDVPTISLDTFIKEKRLEKIDLLKVDIQGSEGALLAGGKYTLSNTEAAIFEISFLDTDVFDTVDIIKGYLPQFKALNPVQYGADVLFHKL